MDKEWVWKFELAEKESKGSIHLSDKVRVSDPCYDMDTWCAGTLENVLPGKYECFSQKVNTGTWGVRIASIEVRHENYLDVEPEEVQDIDVGVDSGQAGIYDLDYFIEVRKDRDGEDEWYWRVCDRTYKELENPNYHNFRESSFWKPEFKEVKSYLNEINKDKTPSIEVIKDYIRAEQEYSCSIERSLFVGSFAANTMDDKCLVSSSGDGDGGYTCLVGRNSDGHIVSIKIDYYYGYEEEEADE